MISFYFMVGGDELLVSLSRFDIAYLYSWSLHKVFLLSSGVPIYFNIHVGGGGFSPGTNRVFGGAEIYLFRCCR